MCVGGGSYRNDSDDHDVLGVSPEDVGKTEVQAVNNSHNEECQNEYLDQH